MSLANVDNTQVVFKNDPKYHKTLLNKTVNILTVNGKKYVGQVLVIDPISQTVVLINKTNGKSKVHILLGHAIKLMSVCKVNESMEIFVERSPPQLQTEDIIIKKEKLKSWLHKNFIHVEEDKMLLKLGDDLIIEPPYDLDHCYSSNTIILERVQNILGKAPIN